MQTNRRTTKPLRVLTDAFIADDGPSGVGAVAVNAPSAYISSVFEQRMGPPEELYLRAILYGLQIGKELGACNISVLCPDETAVKIANRELALEHGSPLAPLYMRIRALIYTYAQAEVRAVPRSRVKHARSLALSASRMPIRRANPQYELFAAR